MDTINPQHLADFLDASRRFFGLVERVKRRKLLALFTATVPMPAFAQYGGRRGFGRSGSDSSKAGKREQTPALETTLHELSEDLKLTPEQQPLFDAYADKVRALGTDMNRERQRKNTASATQDTLLARIDRAVDLQRDRLTAVEDIAQAAKNLFAKLSADQQHVADPRLATVMLIPFESNPRA
jgi:hypothetical protein